MISSPLNAQNEESPWLVYYSNKAPVVAFAEYQLLVLDADYHPPLQALSEQGKTLLGYLSLGEAESGRAHFEKIKQAGVLLQENIYWKGSYYIDLRKPYFPKLVIEVLIPAILHQGFDGIFMDTLDNAVELERQDPEKYRGMRKAAADLVKGIRLHYPYMPIMMNRAYDLLNEVAPFINMILGESVYADYNFETKTYQLVDSALYRKQVNLMKGAKRINPRIGLYTLDYWYADDAATIRKIYAVQQKNGFLPYVATIKLDQIVRRPK